MQTRLSPLRRSSEAAFSLLENVFACGIIAVGLACTYTLNGQCMSILRQAKEEASASQVLQQRIEHLRIANWQRITSGTWIRDSILNVPADGASTLAGVVETVTVVPNTATTGNTFTRTGTTAAAQAGNASLLNHDALVVKWKVTWNGVPAGRLHTRETLAVLGKGGIAK